MKNLFLTSLLIIASPLWAEPLASGEAAPVPVKAEDVETEVKHQEIVVITEAEFVPISKYFQSLDPNQLEPSAAGPVSRQPN